MDNLEDVLNGQAPEDTAATDTPADPPEQTAEAAPSQPRDEHGRFVPKGETEQPAKEPEQAAPPAAETETRIPVQAQIEERRKRQAAEARIEALERQIAQLSQPQPQPQYQPEPEPAYIPDPYEDPQGYAQFVMQQAQATVQSTRADLLVEMARAKYADYDQVEQAYRELIRENPLVHQQAMRQPNPVEYAYQQTKKHLEFQQRGATNVDELKEQLRAELLAELKAQTPAAPQTIPTSLADAQSARASTVPTAPPSLNDILGRR